MTLNKYSIKIRFLTTLITNGLRGGLSLVTGIIIARVLGPSGYGDFNFLLGSFVAFASLVNMGSSNAFYTFISQQPRSRRFFQYYGLWMMIQFLTLMLLVLLLPDFWQNKVWLGHPTEIVLLALCASFAMQQLWQLTGQIGESIRDTIGVQVRNLGLSLVYLICITFLSLGGLLNIKRLFYLNLILYMSFAAAYSWRLYNKGIFLNSEEETFSNIWGEFKKYCRPLVIYSLAGFFYYFADIWFLQYFGGATQQGYYAIGARFAYISLIVTTSILQVFWKEISEAHHLANKERVRYLYVKISRGLYFTTATISCLLIPFSREILNFLLGSAYEGAWFCLSLMFLYPVQQSMGQIAGTFLYATGLTRAKSYIGLFFMGISIPTTYLLLASKTAPIPGFGLGAIGLALKMVFCTLMEVNLMALVIARYYGWKFDWFYQMASIGLLLSASFLSKSIIRIFFSIIGLTFHLFYEIFLTGLVYFILIGVILYLFPWLAGLEQKQINDFLVSFRHQPLETLKNTLAR